MMDVVHLDRAVNISATPFNCTQWFSMKTEKFNVVKTLKTVKSDTFFLKDKDFLVKKNFKSKMRGVGIA